MDFKAFQQVPDESQVVSAGPQGCREGIRGLKVVLEMFQVVLLDFGSFFIVSIEFW